VEGAGRVKAMGPGIACPFEISGRAADVTNLRSPFNLMCGKNRIQYVTKEEARVA